MLDLSLQCEEKDNLVFALQREEAGCAKKCRWEQAPPPRNICPLTFVIHPCHQHFPTLFIQPCSFKFFTKEHEFTPLFINPHYWSVLLNYGIPSIWHSPSFLNMLNSPLSSIIVLTFHLALSNVSPTSYSCNNCYIPEGSTWSHQPWSRLLSTCFFNFLLSSAVLLHLLPLETNKETKMTSGCWCWLAPRRQKNSQQ